ncbi:hypothetical protein WA026_023741 [Henosepilachna vigintioctopunctata]|uniref:Uncharacterized protein n=1 Tax=Henosepilachna vigintioctopunctata TaxID=420089 RepID=A0AAW1UG28_9CUCU
MLIFKLQQCPRQLMHSKKCGIWPFNQNNFTDSDFLAASTTDIPLTNNEPETASSTAEIQQPLQPPLEENPLEPVLTAISTHLYQKTPISEPQPGPSMQDENSVSRSPIRRVCRDLTTFFQNPSPKDILPIPTVEQRNQTRKKYRRGKTVVLTSTPYKNELAEREQLKRTKKCSNLNDPRLKKNSKKQKKTQKARSDGENVGDVLCIYCADSNHTYLKSSERWVAC